MRGIVETIGRWLQRLFRRRHEPDAPSRWRLLYPGSSCSVRDLEPAELEEERPSRHVAASFHRLALREQWSVFDYVYHSGYCRCDHLDDGVERVPRGGLG